MHKKANRMTTCRNKYILKDNQDCLLAYSMLYNSFQDCENKTKPEVNLIGLFFNDLMQIITGYILKRNLLKSYYCPSNEEKRYVLKRFPYVDYRDIQYGVNPDDKDYSVPKQSSSYKRGILSFASKLNLARKWGKPKIGIAKNVVLEKAFFIKLIKKGYYIEFLRPKDIWIPDIEKQKVYLNRAIEGIFESLSIEASLKDMMSVISNHITSRSSMKNGGVLPYDLLLTGSLSEIDYRSYAAKARKQNIPVITVAHGEGEQLIFDEPRFGHSERTYANIFFGFGPDGRKTFEGGKYTKSLFDNPRYVSSNSNFILNMYSEQSIPSGRHLSDILWMYVPDSLLYHRRWGPFGGNIPEGLYLRWQSRLINSFPSIIYKRHPKGHDLFRAMTNEKLICLLDPDRKTNTVIDSRNFYDIYNECDGYIFDHISTAFMIAVATNKPIIYFNIGKRNLIPIAEEKIKERCLWIDMDPDSVEDLRDKVEEKKNTRCKNNLTVGFSIDRMSPEQKRESKLVTLVGEL